MNLLWKKWNALAAAWTYFRPRVPDRGAENFIITEKITLRAKIPTPRSECTLCSARAWRTTIEEYVYYGRYYLLPDGGAQIIALRVVASSENAIAGQRPAVMQRRRRAPRNGLGVRAVGPRGFAPESIRNPNQPELITLRKTLQKNTENLPKTL